MKKLIPALFLSLSLFNNQARSQDTLPVSIQQVSLSNGVVLNYCSKGQGETLIFIHGSLSDLTYWQYPVTVFSKYFHVITYSRRYNWPNTNTPVKNYSAVTDAEDLAALIKTLHLGKVHLIGHSYGALTALFFAMKYPQQLLSMALAEPPAVSLLNHLDGEHHN